MKSAVVFTLTLVLSACGTSHLNCDTSENEALLDIALQQFFDEYINANFDNSKADISRHYPEISVTKFNQHIIDINAKKCEYFIDAHFINSGFKITAVPVTVVFRSTGVNGVTHELQEFYIPQDTSAELGIAVTKNQVN